ncbi:MAG TPA: YbhB/YbcL family Raf kinase inhibitor-like protein [Steroidobacteraceae bacterium]|nr:YbhB/YbcL family Raf kinase inhibitor-like protein [Steroidobacteraceae bacterium]
MRRRIAMLGVVALAVGGAIAQESGSFTLLSPDLQPGGPVPDTFVLNAYGCKGSNQSPALEWHGAPSGTKSFVITVFDGDERNSGSGWWHWVVYDLPASATQLPRGAGAERSRALPTGTKQGRTDLGTDAYHGPCPDVGDPPHHYVFSIYALSAAKLDVPPEPSGAMVTATAKPAVLAKATLTVRYGR